MSLVTEHNWAGPTFGNSSYWVASKVIEGAGTPSISEDMSRIVANYGNNEVVTYSLAASDYVNVGGTDSVITANYVGPPEMIWVEPGTVTMGSPTTEAGRSSNEPQREVTLTNGFYLGKYEVTQAQYELVMTGNTDSLSATPSNWPNNPNRPVEKVSWNDAQVFLARLNERFADILPEGFTYQLPTEAEWEYACRAGTTTRYSWGDTITSDDANYNWDGDWDTGADFKQTRDVGQYSANPWGFFDMHGNVLEWTSDWYSDFSSDPVTNPVGPGSGRSGNPRVRKGGYWASLSSDLRSADRDGTYQTTRSYGIGLRVALKNTFPVKIDTDQTETGSGVYQPGEIVTLSSTHSNDLYSFSDWTVISGGVTISDNTFTMPANEVIVKPSFTFSTVEYTADTDENEFFDIIIPNGGSWFRTYNSGDLVIQQTGKYCLGKRWVLEPGTYNFSINILEHIMVGSESILWLITAAGTNGLNDMNPFPFGGTGNVSFFTDGQTGTISRSFTIGSSGTNMQTMILMDTAGARIEFNSFKLEQTA